MIVKMRDAIYIQDEDTIYLIETKDEYQKKVGNYWLYWSDQKDETDIHLYAVAMKAIPNWRETDNLFQVTNEFATMDDYKATMLGKTFKIYKYTPVFS
jgi:hypothetical protein